MQKISQTVNTYLKDYICFTKDRCFAKSLIAILHSWLTNVSIENVKELPVQMILIDQHSGLTTMASTNFVSVATFPKVSKRRDLKSDLHFLSNTSRDTLNNPRLGLGDIERDELLYSVKPNMIVSPKPDPYAFIKDDGEEPVSQPAFTST